MGGTGWGAATPILRVSDLDASLMYYMNVLGFKLDWRAGQ
ncbi:MAG TPA: VOC family protein [Methylomirabilota bacterium]|nr:VOC family protein [Methylomirabilota bacterium]